MEDYTTGVGQRLRVHSKTKECETHNCCIHNPSDHPLRIWPTSWRSDRGLMERICGCGVGHPDPDGIDFIRRKLGGAHARIEGVHGCCSKRCCHTKEK